MFYFLCSNLMRAHAHAHTPLEYFVEIYDLFVENVIQPINLQ